MTYIDVYKNDNGKAIVLSMDSILRVNLEENPSTGYAWQEEEQSSSCLQLVSKDFFANNNLVIGAAGIATFYFKPVKMGRCPLTLKLWRSWEGDHSVVKWFHVSVSIING
jgi:predicted secreted protein